MNNNTQRHIGLLVFIVGVIVVTGVSLFWLSQNDDNAADEQSQTTQQQTSATPDATTVDDGIDRETTTRIDQALTEEQQDCRVSYPLQVDDPLEEEGFSIQPASISTALLSCHTSDETRYEIVDGNLSINVQFADKDTLNAAPSTVADEVWLGDFQPFEEGHQLQIGEKDDEALLICPHEPELPNCNDDYEIAVDVTHPNFQTVAITLRDSARQETPRLELYATLLESIILP